MPRRLVPALLLAFPFMAASVPPTAVEEAREQAVTAHIEVTDSLLADDYSGARLDWVLAEHRRLFSAPVAAKANRVLVGHRTPAIMVLGQSVGAQAFPEGSALVLEPRQDGARVLGILTLAPIEGGGFHSC